MAFGMFGSVFLGAQFLQTVQDFTPLEAGIRTLPWTAMPVLTAPIAGHPQRPHRRPPDRRARPAAADGRHRAGSPP